MQVLEAPAGFLELNGEPVEQFRMGGRGALGTEVVLRLHEAAPEVLLPHSINEHAGGEGMIG